MNELTKPRKESKPPWLRLLLSGVLLIAGIIGISITIYNLQTNRLFIEQSINTLTTNHNQDTINAEAFALLQYKRKVDNRIMNICVRAATELRGKYTEREGNGDLAKVLMRACDLSQSATSYSGIQSIRNHLLAVINYLPAIEDKPYAPELQETQKQQREDLIEEIRNLASEEIDSPELSNLIQPDTSNPMFPDQMWLVYLLALLSMLVSGALIYLLPHTVYYMSVQPEKSEEPSRSDNEKSEQSDIEDIVRRIVTEDGDKTRAQVELKHTATRNHATAEHKDTREYGRKVIDDLYNRLSDRLNDLDEAHGKIEKILSGIGDTIDQIKKRTDRIPDAFKHFDVFNKALKTVEKDLQTLKSKECKARECKTAKCEAIAGNEQLLKELAKTAALLNKLQSQLEEIKTQLDTNTEEGKEYWEKVTEVVTNALLKLKMVPNQ